MIGLPKDFLTLVGDGSSADHNAVGVRYYKATKDHPPLRLFYPAKGPTSTTMISSSKPVRWFEETGSLSFLKGYAHMILAREHTATHKWLAMPLVYLLSWLLPMSWLRIPGLYKDAPFAFPKEEAQKQKKLPVIIFSHGLTGTGQENAALCTMWAKQGFIVAAVHHTDGSACHVTLADGSEHYYVHGPPMTEYDATFRPKQVLHRANEMLQACQFFSSSGECPEEIRLAADYPKRVVAAGYSFGAATVARAIVLLEKEQQQFQFQFQFCAALFLDGWFHIDVKKSAGIEFQFPQEAFDNDEQGNGDGDGLLPEDMPTCFINSEQFQNYDKLFAATNKLAGKNNPNVQVIAGTGHQNFCDVVFWMHNSVLRSLMMGAVGKTVDPGEAFQDIVQRSITFLKKAAAASA